MPQVIRGLPEHIATVPDEGRDWLVWREKALAFREAMHRLAEDDPEKRAAIVRLAADDPAFFMLVFGCLIEPRTVTDMRVVDDEVQSFVKPQGWYPWVPYPFQIEIVRWIEDVMSRANDPRGRGDGILEKSRDMGATWVFCLYAAHQWLFADDFVAGLISHKEDLVDSNDPKSMFFRIEALLGMNTRVPEQSAAPGTIFDGLRVRIPAYLMPAGYEPKLHNLKLNLIHPTKSNFIVGESTTAKSGIGSRTTMSIIDEAAKIDDLLTIWSGMGPVTSHRFALSSADRSYGDGMYILANRGKLAAQDPNRNGPSFLTLPWNKHPLRDGGWLQAERNRYEGNEAGFAQEYEIDWDAGQGDWVYPAAKTILPTTAPFDPNLGEVWITIEHPLRDGVWLQAERNRYEGNEAGFAQEYEIDWDAGQGDWVYPAAKTILPTPAPFDPNLGEVWITIDPALRDETALAFIQYEPGTSGWYRLVEALVYRTPSARYLAPILMGFPRGHPAREPYGEHAFHEVMDLTWELREKGHPVRIVGDTYGDSALGAEKQSFYESLLLTSRELNELYDDLKPVELVVMTKYDEGARYHRKRKESLANKLPTLRFNDTARCRYFLDAVQSYRYKGQEEGRMVMNEPNKPAHDWSSHPTTALEYWAVMATIQDFNKQPMLTPLKANKRKPKKTVRSDPPGFRRLVGSV